MMYISIPKPYLIIFRAISMHHKLDLSGYN